MIRKLLIVGIVLGALPGYGQDTGTVKQSATVTVGQPPAVAKPPGADEKIAAALDAIRVNLGSMDARLTALEQRGTVAPPLAVAPPGPSAMDAAALRLESAADRMVKAIENWKAPAPSSVSQNTDVKIVPNARVREDDDPPAPKAYRQVTTDDPNSLPVGTLKHEGGRWYRLTGAGAWVPHNGATPSVPGVAVASVPTVPLVTGWAMTPTTGVTVVGTSPPPAPGPGLSVASTRTGHTITSARSAGTYGSTSGGCASGGCAAAGSSVNAFSFTGPFGGGIRSTRVR